MTLSSIDLVSALGGSGVPVRRTEGSPRLIIPRIPENSLSVSHTDTSSHLRGRGSKRPADDGDVSGITPLNHSMSASQRFFLSVDRPDSAVAAVVAGEVRIVLTEEAAASRFVLPRSINSTNRSTAYEVNMHVAPSEPRISHCECETHPFAPVDEPVPAPGNGPGDEPLEREPVLMVACPVPIERLFLGPLRRQFAVTSPESRRFSPLAGETPALYRTRRENMLLRQRTLYATAEESTPPVPRSPVYMITRLFRRASAHGLSGERPVVVGMGSSMHLSSEEPRVVPMPPSTAPTFYIVPVEVAAAPRSSRWCC